MNAIAIGLCALAAGLLLAGLLLWRRELRRGRQRARDGRRRPPSVESGGDMHGTSWPDGWRGIPKSKNGDGIE